MDLFGDVADEKSVTGITKDVPEAKTHRAYETYRLLGRYVSQQSFGNILSSLKEVSSYNFFSFDMAYMFHSLLSMSLHCSS